MARETWLNDTLIKTLHSCILISLTAFILSGCAGQGQETEKQETVIESAQAEEQKAEEVGEAVEETAEPLIESDNQNMLENAASQGSSIVKVRIHNEEEYQAFVDCLEEYVDCFSLTLNLEETNTVIYLDEILAYQNFHFLTIKNGGTISARNMEILNESPVRNIELYHTYAIEENILSQMPALQYITIRLNNWYTGVLPAKELLHNTDCSNIVLIWDDDRQDEVNLEELAEWGEINAALLENNCYLKGLYVLNDDEYNYISYEFCGCGEKIGNVCETKVCKAFICIKDRESYGDKYFDILEVPVESIEMRWYERNRMMLDDMNFDGYRDLIFQGHTGGSLDEYGPCIGFLWNKKEQRYEWNTTVPKYYKRIDAERKRIIFSYHNSITEEYYYIYEYNGSIFTEKRLEVTGSMTENGLTWQYYEDGELLKRLVETYGENGKLYYITYEEKGIITEEVIEKNDYKYTSYTELGKEYFPEFDFYFVG